MADSRDLEDVLRRLPVIPGREPEIPGLAAHLRMTDWAERANARPNLQLGGSKRAQYDLHRFWKLSYSLARHLREMRREGRGALAAHLADPNGGRPALHPTKLQLELRLCIEAAERAHGSIDLEAPALGGAPEKRLAAALTKSGAAVYERLTGRKATYSTNPITNSRGGPFVRFMAQVFVCFRIKASAQQQVKEYRKSRPKKTH